jgi:L-histidine N-alpha-methyltransferase
MQTDKELQRIEVQNLLDHSFEEDISKDVYNGLTASQKYLSSKYFYDTRGSHLFEEICLLSEYYPTRTELSILKEVAPHITYSFDNTDLVELGSGGNAKIRALLDSLDESELETVRYVPVDVSETALIAESEELIDIYPQLNVLCLVADFTRHLDMLPKEREKFITFFGSTIGNFDEKSCNDLLNKISQAMEKNDRFLIGLDRVKPKEILEAAYNDPKGMTAEFNKNILNVLNRELNADFDLSDFEHIAFFNKEKSRVEMHLKANCPVTAYVNALNLPVKLAPGETIHTEISRKFTRESAEKMFAQAGLAVKAWYSDPNEWFSLVELTK